MIVGLAKRSSTQLATGKLLREGREYPFKYETVEPRRLLVEHPTQGYMTVIATMSIKTITDLKFAMGDKVVLEEKKEPLMIQRITPRKLNQKQYMYLKKAIGTEYTLDLA